MPLIFTNRKHTDKRTSYLVLKKVQIPLILSKIYSQLYIPFTATKLSVIKIRLLIVPMLSYGWDQYFPDKPKQQTILKQVRPRQVLRAAQSR